MLKYLRTMGVLKEHWVRSALRMFEDAITFWWDSALVTNFIRREFNTITWLEFLVVFSVKYYLEPLGDQEPGSSLIEARRYDSS